MVLKSRTKKIYLALILLGVLLLLVKSWTAAWLPNILVRYTGNFSVSFAVYFLARLGILDWLKPRFQPWVSLAAALLVVESFELLNGYGLMANTYDPWDLLANALGVGLAFGLDRLLLNGAER